MLEHSSRVSIFLYPFYPISVVNLPDCDSERKIELWMTRGALGLLFIFRTIVFRGVSDLQCDQTGDQHGQEKLAGERFQGGQGTCRWRHRDNISVPQGG